MLGQSLGLLFKLGGRWAGSRATEIALTAVAGICFLVALIIGSVAAHQALVPLIGLAWATAAVAAFYLLLGLIALIVVKGLRRKRRRIAANLIATAPQTTPSMMLLALAAGALFGLGRPPARRRRF